MGLTTILSLFAGPLAADLPTILAQFENIIKAQGNQGKIQVAINGLLPIAQKFEQAFVANMATSSNAGGSTKPATSLPIGTAVQGGTLANGVYMVLNGTLTKIV